MTGDDKQLLEARTEWVDCLACGHDNQTKLIPSAKFDRKVGAQNVTEEFHLVLCERCGLVYENPQVVLEESEEYLESNYYNAGNEIAEHDRFQREMAPFRYSVLRDRFDWKSFTRVADIGAAGAVSAIMKKHNPHLESVLIEPSGQAIENCRQRYPEVRAEHTIFETFEDEPGSYDLFTCYYAFSFLAKPYESLARARRLLKPDGQMVICLGHLALGIEVWLEHQPWVNMSSIGRGVALVYFTAQSLRAVVEAAGFEVVEEFAFEYPFWYPRWTGRQEYYMTIRPKPGVDIPVEDMKAAADPDEVEAARNFFPRYCEMVSENSIDLFLAENEVPSVLLLHDGDEDYADWVSGLLSSRGVPVSASPADEWSDNPPSDGGWIWLIGDHGQDEKALAEATGAKVRNCTLPHLYPGFRNIFEGEVGRLIVRACVPARDFRHRLFPFEKRPAVNDVTLKPKDIGFRFQDNLAAREKLDERREVLAELIVSMPRDIRDRMLRPLWNVRTGLGLDEGQGGLETCLTAATAAPIARFLEDFAWEVPGGSVEAAVRHLSTMIAAFRQQQQ
jgi:SAM-dependent methyltransferase